MASSNQLIHKDSVSVTVQACEIEADGEVPVKMRKPWSSRLLCLPSQTLADYVGHDEARRLIHGMKVGLALVLVSLLYILDVIHDRLGDNSMWAIMTVIVMFELTSGATIGKGVNRGIGTIVGGGIGILVAMLAHEISGWGRAVLIASFVFLFCSAASYIRLIPKIKRKHDYGVMIFILTFNLVAVSGVRGDQIVKVATDRLLAIFMGFAICIFTSLFIFPVWAGDELHGSLVSKLNSLASSVEDNLEEYFKPLNIDGKSEEQLSCTLKGCIPVLYSKSTDEMMANFAKWEPWHGRFGFYYPFDKYLEIGEHLRDLAVTILSLRSCLKSKHHGISVVAIKEQCEATGMLIGSILRELGAHIKQMTRFEAKELLLTKLGHTREELSSLLCLSNIKILNQNTVDGAQITYFLLVLMNIIDGVEKLVKKIEELEAVAGFKQQ